MSHYGGAISMREQVVKFAASILLELRILAAL